LNQKAHLTLLDIKIIKFIATNCIPFTVVEDKSFKALLPVNDRNALKGRHHYSDAVLPMYYKDMRKTMKSLEVLVPVLHVRHLEWSHRQLHQVSFGLVLSLNNNKPLGLA